MADDVQVKFGGETSDLDNASKKAVQDINEVGNATQKMGGIFSRVTGFVKDFGTGLRAGLRDGLAEAQKSSTALSNVGVSAEGASSKMGRFTLVAAGAAAAMATLAAVIKTIKWAGQFGDMAEQLDQAAQRSGMTATQISGLQAVATSAGMSADSLNSSMTRLQRNMVLAANGSKQQSAAFNALGIDVTKVKSSYELTMQVAEKFQNMENGPKKVAIAMSLMGRSGADMIPILNQGRQGIEAQIASADKYGAVVSEKFMTAGLAVDEAMDNMNLGLKGVQKTLFEALAPAITATVEGFNSLIQEFMESYRTGGAVKTILDAIAVTAKVVISAIAALATTFSHLWSIAKMAVTGIMGLLMTLGNTVSAVFRGDFSGAVANFKAGMQGTSKVVTDQLNEMKSKQQGLSNFYKKMWSDLKAPKTKDVAPEIGDLNMPGLVGDGGAAAAKKAADERMRALLEEIEFKKDLARDDFEEQMRLQDEKLARIKEYYGQDSREYQRALREKERLSREYQQELLRIEQDRITRAAQIQQTQASAVNDVANIEVQRAREAAETMNQIGAMSSQEKIAELARLHQQESQLEIAHQNNIYNIQMASLQSQLKLENLRPTERRRILGELEQLEAEHAARMTVITARQAQETQRIQNQAAVDLQQRWMNVLNPIGSAFDSAFQKIRTGSEGWKTAILGMLDQVLQSFISMGIQMATQWAATELAKTAATTAGAATRTAAETAAAATGSAVAATAGMTQVATNAAVGASGAFAATAPIPFVGPGLAPGVAAAALAAILGFGAMIASARGGYDIPSGTNPITQLHEKEMVLPAHIAEPLRASLRGASPRVGAASGMSAAAGSSLRSEGISRRQENTFNYQPSVTREEADLETMLRKQGRQFRKWMQNQARNGSYRMGDNI